MLLPQPTYSEGWRILTPHEDKVDVFSPQSNYCSEGVANCNVIMVMMTVSVEQRPGWGEHVQFKMCFIPQPRALFQHAN